MKKIGYLFKGGRKDRIDPIKNHESPEDFFYGAYELERRGYNVDIIEENEILSLDRTFKNNLINKVGSFFGINFYIIKGLKYKKVLNRINEFDYLIATTNSHGRTLSFLKRFNIIKPEIIFISMGSLPLGFHPLKTVFFKFIFKKSTIFTLSKNELIFLKRKFKSGFKKIYYIPFGVDADFWVPRDERNGGNYVLTIGNDLNRDYKTLIESWQPEFPLLKIITRLNISNQLPPNIEVIKGDWRGQIMTDKEILKLIQDSLFIIIPIRQTIQPSGQSFCFQSMSCGKVVIMANIAGLWDSSLMIDGVDCFLYEVGNSVDLCKKIKFLLNRQPNFVSVGQEARKKVIENFTIKHIADAVEKIIC